jgi:2-polyprenyl-3-methyl-5-hydroxy-6-metoxy-1,4-benzoquinol methylase
MMSVISRRIRRRLATGWSERARPSASRPQQDFLCPSDYAALYDGCTPTARFFKERLERVLCHLHSLDGGKLLDVGCGPGILPRELIGSRFELFGIDQSTEMIREARAATAHCQVHLEVGRAEQLPYANRSFDVVLALGVLEYVSDLDTAVAELARVARPSAIVIVSMLNRRSPYWLARYGRSWLAKALSLMSGRKPDTGHGLAVCSRRRLTEVMKRHGIRPTHTVYYGADMCVGPLSAGAPELSAFIRLVTKGCHGWVLNPWVCSAFLIMASVMLDTL